MVRGPDLLWGCDIRTFHPPGSIFDGVIAGSPCQDFSTLTRTPTDYSDNMLAEFRRVVLEAFPEWFLLENVPTVPDITVPGYHVQRFDLNARECGMRQSRLRHFQFGSKSGFVIIPKRQKPYGHAVPICLASEGKKANRRSWSDFCAAQGLPRSTTFPGLSIAARYAAVGNGVPIPMAQVIARSVLDAHILHTDVRLCACGCGRRLTGRQLSATPACRKRLERRRKRDASISSTAGHVTPQET